MIRLKIEVGGKQPSKARLFKYFLIREYAKALEGASNILFCIQSFSLLLNALCTPWIKLTSLKNTIQSWVEYFFLNIHSIIFLFKCDTFSDVLSCLHPLQNKFEMLLYIRMYNAFIRIINIQCMAEKDYLCLLSEL